MTQFNVDVNASNDVVSEFSRTEQSVLQTIQELEQQAERSLSSWTGDAQEHYAQAKAQWTAGVQEMTTNFSSAISALNQMIEGYNDGDRSVSRQFTR